MTEMIFRCFKTSWGIYVELTGNVSALTARMTEDLVELQPGVYFRNVDPKFRLLDEEIDQIRNATNRMHTELLRFSDGAPCLITIDHVLFTPTDYQVEGMQAAMCDFLALELGVESPFLDAYYDSPSGKPMRGAKYVFRYKGSTGKELDPTPLFAGTDPKSARPAESQWQLSLAAWTIRDGNYPDFERPQIAEFAVEFWPFELAACETAETPWARRVTDCTYEIRGHVVASGEGSWALDLGGLVVFHQASPPLSLATASWVAGTIGLGIDPYYYFERLFDNEGVPPLVYSWKVDEIQRHERSRWKTLLRLKGGGLKRSKWASIARTDAWTDDTDYLLTCTLLNADPKRRSRTAT